MSAAQWKIRMENEYRAMCAFPINGMFSWKIAEGETVPQVKNYLVTYYVRTVVKVNGRLHYQYSTTVLISLPENPGGSAHARIVKGHVPFNPNIFPEGNFCLGNIWRDEPVLWKLVVNIGKVLAFDPEHINARSPANPDAAADWQRKQSGHAKPYPCGNIHFPRPVGY